MPQYKVTLFMNSGVTGWSESYYNSANSPADVLPKARALANKRIALCGNDVDMPHIRVSDVSVRGDALFDSEPGYTTKSNHPSLTQTKNATPEDAADVSWTSALFTMAKDNVAIARIFARGIADAAFTSDRVFTPTQQWIHFFNRYAREYGSDSNGWGVFRKPKSTPLNTFPIINAVHEAGKQLVIKTVPGFGTAVGSKVAIRGLKCSAGTISGNYLVTEVLGMFITIAKVLKPAEVLFQGNTGTIQVATPVFVTGLWMSFSRLATSRHAGRPFGVLVGRRKRPMQLL